MQKLLTYECVESKAMCPLNVLGMLTPVFCIFSKIIKGLHQYQAYATFWVSFWAVMFLNWVTLLKTWKKAAKKMFHKCPNVLTSPFLSHTKAEFKYSQTNVKWKSNDFWVFPASEILEKLTQRLNDCRSVRHTQCKHTGLFASFMPSSLVLLYIFCPCPFRYLSIKAMLMLYTEEKNVS